MGRCWMTVNPDIKWGSLSSAASKLSISYPKNTKLKIMKCKAGTVGCLEDTTHLVNVIRKNCNPAQANATTVHAMMKVLGSMEDEKGISIDVAIFFYPKVSCLQRLRTRWQRRCTLFVIIFPQFEIIGSCLLVFFLEDGRSTAFATWIRAWKKVGICAKLKFESHRGSFKIWRPAMIVPYCHVYVRVSPLCRVSCERMSCIFSPNFVNNDI